MIVLVIQFRVIFLYWYYLSNFKADGIILDECKRLKRSTKASDIPFFRRIKMLLRALYGPTDLFLLFLFLSAILSLLVGSIKNKCLHLSLR